MCGCSQMTTTTMELPSLVCLCVLISCGVSSADANERVKVIVKEDSDAILPCSLSTKENIESILFDWKKDGQKEVFMYDKGEHYNNKPSDRQDRQFKDRVFHFQNELKHGNASIIIRDSKVADRGNYTCDFPHLQPEPQTFHIRLVVDYILKRRNISGAAPEPYITILGETNDWSLLQCAVRGAFPEPKVEWKDSSGNIVPAKKSQVTKRGDKYDIILKATVTKTDNFSCVATQEEIHHQIESQIFVHINGAASKPLVTTLKRDNEVLLQCEVLGVSPKTEVEWKDSSGNIVPAEEPKITERGGSHDIILEAPVTKTDNFRCVVTQKEIDHQIYAEIYATHEKPEESSQGSSTGWIASTAVLCVVVLVSVVGNVLYHKGFIKVNRQSKTGSSKNSTPEEQNLNSSDNQRPEA